MTKRNVSCYTVRQTTLLSSLHQFLEMSAFCLYTRLKTLTLGYSRGLHPQSRSGPCGAKRLENGSLVRQCCAAATDALVAGCYRVSCNRRD